MAIKDWPLTERPREKLLERGAAALSDAELLAIFLRTGTRGQSAIELARELLARFGGLRALLDCRPEDFLSAKGAGTAKFVQLRAALELGRRYLEAGLRRTDSLTSPEATRRFLKLQIQPYDREVFACLFLDNRHRVIAFEPLFFGTIDTASVHPREVLKAALRHNAAALILTHNHPSGVAEPSRADEQLTRRLKDALAVVDIRVLDHIVVGDGEPVSLAERGLV
ncbi:MAG: DNA repair protein RadC [Gammaproteobacteria bacterium]